MKKSTKIITTAVALVLVMSFMVVGILAATSATASITAQVNWTATAGLEFFMSGATYYSKENQTFLAGKGFTFEDMENDGNLLPGAQYVDFKPLANVNTTTTNDDATGMTATLNATFVDDSDDGVNNPRDIVYCYWFSNSSADHYLNITFTSLPETTGNVEIKYLARNTYNFHGSIDDHESVSSTKPTSITAYNSNYENYQDGEAAAYLLIKLHVIDPDVSVTNFNANVSFSFSKVQ